MHKTIKPLKRTFSIQPRYLSNNMGVILFEEMNDSLPLDICLPCKTHLSDGHKYFQAIGKENLKNGAHCVDYMQASKLEIMS